MEYCINEATENNISIENTVFDHEIILHKMKRNVLYISPDTLVRLYKITNKAYKCIVMVMTGTN